MIKNMRFFSTCWQAILEVLFPECCAACGRKLVQEGQTICSSCFDSIVRTEHAHIPNNGIDMLIQERLSETKKHIRYVRGAAFAYYNPDRGRILRLLIEHAKFGLRTNPMIFYDLGRKAADEYVGSALLEDIDLLVPIPLHPHRLRERGFNQAEYICKALHEITKIPMDTEHLVRVRNNPHQSRSAFDKRQANVEDVFAIRYPEEWKGKHILLVDDVITSGATVFSCMKHTSSIRDCRVSVFAIGWAHN
jgi:ComF family protein